IWNHRERIPRPLLILLLWAIILSILSKMSFTLYTDVYGFNNVLGHILRFGSVLLVYRAIALGALKDPFQTLFRDLAISHQALDAELIQRKQTEQALRKTNRELDGFVHTVSHDLRSPLTVITGSAEVLRSELAEKIDKPYLNLLDNIENRGHHMASLLNNLLSLASIGRIEKPTETVETGSVVAQVVEDLRQEVIAANCQLVVEELPPLQGHVSLIYQLFLNLLSNALRYGANPEQAIVVSANKQENTIELIVSDHGPGIDKQERETIFDVFYRGVSDPQKPGTGIGLASIKKIAHYYGGEIRVEETPGGGATFRVMLPQPENDS
ncbi:MAG: HAMP domain-containing histidine kinase, partial [Desulfuromonadales bacterium]|nr:HAMP domain-containing histidine kinase [Desulfuromonadales bacterium]